MTPRRGFRYHAGAASLVAACLTVAACGSSSSSSGGSASSSGAASSSTASSIKLGLAIPLTGTGSDDTKQSLGAATAWEKYVNASGGISGHPVDLVVADTKSDAATAVSVVKKLVQQDHVIALVSDDGTDEAAYGAYTKQANIPVIGIGYDPTVWGGLANWFTTATSFPVVATNQFAAAQAIGTKSFAILTCVEEPACAEISPLYQGEAQATGIGYAGLIAASSDAPSYTAQCLQFISKKADFIQINLNSSVGVKAAADCRQQGYTGWFGAGGGSVVADHYSDPALKLAGALNGFPWYSTAAPVVKFRALMKQYGDSTYQDSTSTALWSALELFHKALSSSTSTPTKDTVFAAYYALHGEDLDGLLPQAVTYTKGKPAPGVNCFWTYKLQNNTFTSLPASGTSGNSVTSGDLESTCQKPLS